MFEGVVNVSAGLTNPTRILYSKVAKKAKFLDDFLTRRLQLKSLEERRIELKTGIKQTPEPIPTTAKKSETNVAEKGFESMTSITSDMPQTPEDKECDLKKRLDQADEDKKLGVTRVYSSFDTSGKLYLKSIQTVAEAEAKKQSKIIKYPLVRIIIIYWTVYLLYKLSWD